MYERYQDVTHKLVNFIEGERWKWLNRYDVGYEFQASTFWGKKKK